MFSTKYETKASVVVVEGGKSTGESNEKRKLEIGTEESEIKNQLGNSKRSALQKRGPSLN